VCLSSDEGRTDGFDRSTRLRRALTQSTASTSWLLTRVVSTKLNNFSVDGRVDLRKLETTKTLESLLLMGKILQLQCPYADRLYTGLHNKKLIVCGYEYSYTFS
jgi:hypothetical protein